MSDAGSRHLAYDTRVLPDEVLSGSEKDIIREIHGLLREAAKAGTATGTDKDPLPWADPEPGRHVNIIMLEGQRGAGKTSLLLTMLKGWRRPENFKSLSNEFREMNALVRALAPLDFDPLPPDLPILSWIIQAFEPLVRTVSRDSLNLCADEYDVEPDDNSLQGQYRRLQRIATVGWTAGTLQGAMVKDFAEYLVWEGEQQGSWHDLEAQWAGFMDKLLPALEQGRYGLFPQGGLLVLPVDDVDLQVRRVRDLLQAMRLLRHERLVYLITADLGNLDLVLTTEYLRDFCADISTQVTDSWIDEVREQSRQLGPKLRQKTIPGSNIKWLLGIPVSAVLDWMPVAAGMALGKILDECWNALENEQPEKQKATLSKFIRERQNPDDFTLAFRPLQNFYDRWGSGQYGWSGVRDFVELLVTTPREDDLWVLDRPTLLGGDKPANRSMEITGAPFEFAPAPRIAGHVSCPGSQGAQISIKWFRSLDFARFQWLPYDDDAEDGGGGYTQAFAVFPRHVLALDLAQEFPEHFQLNGPRLASRSLSLVWTEVMTAAGRTLLPWPMPRPLPASPAEWLELGAAWNERLVQCATGAGHTRESVFHAWVGFFDQNGSDFDWWLALICSLSGVSDIAEREFGFLHIHDKSSADEAFFADSCFVPGGGRALDCYELAMVPSTGATRFDTDLKNKVLGS